MESSIFVAIPVLSGIEPRMQQSLELHRNAARWVGGVECDVRYYTGGTGIERARNRLAAVFLDGGWTHYCQWDADIEVMDEASRADAGGNVFGRLLGLGREFVGGIYGAHDARGRVKTSTSVKVDGTRPVYGEGVVEIRWLSGGFWLVRRSVIERLVAVYVGDESVEVADGVRVKRLGLFNEFALPVQWMGEDGGMLQGQTRLGEDYAFCERWRMTGGKIWADTGIKLRHWGKAGYVLEGAE